MKLEGIENQKKIMQYIYLWSFSKWDDVSYAR